MTREEFREDVAMLREDAAALLEIYLARPLLRGISHLIAFFAAIVGIVAMAISAAALLPVIASVIYGFGLAGMLGASSLYHRGRWRRMSVQRLCRKLDHSMIFVLIASTYSPFILLGLSGGWRVTALAAIWTAALGGVILRLTVDDLPRWLMVAVYIGLGGCALALMPTIGSLSTVALVLACIGGGLYVMGAMVYLVKRPNPLPRIFGFHEVFHVFVLAAAACHFAAVWDVTTTATM